MPRKNICMQDFKAVLDWKAVALEAKLWSTIINQHGTGFTCYTIELFFCTQRVNSELLSWGFCKYKQRGRIHRGGANDKI